MPGQHPASSRAHPEPPLAAVAVQYCDGLWDVLSVVFVFVFPDFEFFSCINLQYFYVKMLIIFHVADLETRKLYPLPFWLWRHEHGAVGLRHELTSCTN